MGQGIPEERERQFDHLEKGKTRLVVWSEREKFPLHRVEFVVPFVDTDFSAHVLFFLETDAQVRAESSSRLHDAQEVFVRALRDAGYPEQHVALLTFEADSDERVQREFAGSYFGRLR